MIQPNLSWILILPLLGLGLVCLTPADKTCLIRRISGITVLLPFLLSIWVYAAYDHSVGGFQLVQNIPWVTPLGISYHLGVDGINSLLLLLVGAVSLSASLISSSIKDRVKEYYVLLLITVIGTYGAFLSLDVFFFYFFHEIAAVPVFLMIAIWGSERREFAAMKLTLYLAAGAAIALVGLLALYIYGPHTFDYTQLQVLLARNPIPLNIQNWIFLLITLGFGITLTLWPFYTWAPVGYAEAPTAISMLHAGVLKKMGAYAILRFAIALLPQAAHIWMPFIAVLAILNIVYCGFVALTQRDLKYILGYSSCSHMGYILLGLACFNSLGINGVVYLMFAHGIMAALAFALTGFVTDQTKTRNLDELGGLLKVMPFVGTCFIMAALASAGVPGFANFVAEILVLLAAFGQYPWLDVLAIFGLVITAIYLMKVIRLGFQGPLSERFSALKDAVTLTEKLPYVLLMVLLILVGCLPGVIIKHINSSTQPIVESIQ